MQRRTFFGLAATAAFSVLAAREVFGAVLAPTTTGNNPKFIPLEAIIPDTPQAAGAVVSLPQPDKTGGAPLMQTLAQRRATRELHGLENGGKAISGHMLSNLLWAAWGVNRADGKRTAPTARNSQAADVYVALKSGIWLYNARKNQLELQVAKDVREALGKAPLTLIYAAQNDFFGAMSVGSLYQNAGLYCASEGLGNVVRASNTGVVDKLIKLPDDYKIWVTQSIGWPAP
ncbi:MAG: nitroreductase family protein [Deltaproteobacteria bacterium]|jgi:hypothetical protein|nr:nitroreductase family protein [Deltaproteobacteria bacterium]